MRTRPWPLVILALLQVLTPVFNILFNAWILKVSPMLVLAWLFEKPWFVVFQFLLLMPIAGIAIYRMRKWSYLVFFVAIAWSMVSNLSHLRSMNSVLPQYAVVLVYILDLILVGYFLIPAVRATYFDPRLRWWESKPRYEVEIPATLSHSDGNSGSRDQGTIQNISEGGAFVLISRKVSRGELVQVEFSVLTQQFIAPGKVVYSKDLPDGTYSYGIQFLHSSESLWRFKRLAKGLKYIGFKERMDHKPWYQDLSEWGLNLLRTGKGWTPNVPHSKRSQST